MSWLPDLPVVSAFNVDRRKELSDRFLQFMNSSMILLSFVLRWRLLLTKLLIWAFTDSKQILLKRLPRSYSREG